MFTKNHKTDKVEAPKDIAIIYLAWMLGESYAYDYTYSDKLDIYQADEAYKIVGIETLKKGELTDQTIIDICNGK